MIGGRRAPIGHCRLCGINMKRGGRNPGKCTRIASYDHILPKARGGGDDRSNLRVCCRLCNQALTSVDACAGALACIRAVIGRSNVTDINRYLAACRARAMAEAPA